MLRTRMRSAPAAAVAMLAAGLLLLPATSAAPAAGASSVDESTREQLARTARTIIEQRSQALVERSRPEPLPAEIFGVRISPRLAFAQQEAVRELRARNRAPVPGGPAFIAARTRLTAVKAVRVHDRITLDATEYTEVEYEPTGDGRPPVLRQAVRRRFEFKADGRRLTLLGERRLGTANTAATASTPVPEGTAGTEGVTGTADTAVPGGMPLNDVTDPRPNAEASTRRS